jgi:glucokinase-like ROK family protein
MSAAATTAPTLRVGVDIGGSKVAVLVVDPSDAVVGRRLVPALPSDPDAAIERIAAVVLEAVGDAGATLADVKAIGIGVPGRVDAATGDVTFAVNLGWQHLPLGRRLETALGVPIVVENDVRAAAVGLHLGQTFGATDDLVYLGIGTGISAGVVLDGRLHRGVRGLAGEIGHVVLDPDGAPCACGLRGCFETIAAGAGIARAAREAVATGPTTLAALPDPTAADVFAAAADGDEAATRIVERAAGAIARIVHELVLAYDVELVVLGGGISRAGDALLERVHAGLAAIGAPSPFAAELLAETTVRLAGPDHDLGTRGAVALLGTVTARTERPESASAAEPAALAAAEEVVARERVS